MTRTSGDPLSDLNLDASDHVSFMRVRLREGYAVGQVDAFVDRALQALSSDSSPMRPEDVRAVRFTPVRVRAGYDMREVDSFLDGVEAQLAARHHQPRCEEQECPPAASRRRPGTPPLWATRLKWGLLVLVVAIWIFAQVFTRH